jgi:cupin fold WbuC family metalloprotein
MPSARALNAPSEAVVVLSQRDHVERALEASRASERQRMILPFHKHDDDLLHRMLNALQPSTYVRPHRHRAIPKPEIFVLLRGAIDFVVFDDAGEITHAARLSAGGEQFGVDVSPGLFHTLLVREADTVVYEVKLGPYEPSSDKDFAPWAPPEGAADVSDYVLRLETQLRGFLGR